MLNMRMVNIGFNIQTSTAVQNLKTVNDNLKSIQKTVQDINKFIKSFEMTQKMMKKMKSDKGGMKKLMKGIDENTLKNFKF